MGYVEKNLNYDWNWTLLSRNQNLNPTKVSEIIKNKLQYNYLSLNKYIGINFIKNNIDKDFNWKNISMHRFNYDRYNYIKHLILVELNVILYKKLCTDTILKILDYF